MRIGILTHHYVSNFGAYLQAYCLREAIAQMRPNDTVEIIDFVLPKHKLINTAGMCRFDPKRETLRSWAEKVKLVGTFARARRDLHLTKRVRDAKGILSLGLDKIVVGSDEVWNYLDVRSFHPVKFGVGLEGAHLIAYAPSTGLTTDFSHMDAHLIEGLSRFSALSARDLPTGRMISEKLHKSFTPVLDPVLIQNPPAGRTARVAALTAKPYALMYHFGLPYEKQTRDLYPKLRSAGLTILGAGEYNRGYDRLSVDLTPFEMAELFRGAQYVFTGTFHGVVLSVIHQTPFIACPNNLTRARKIASLLEDLGLKDRLIEPEDFDFEKVFRSAPDYRKAYPMIEEKRQKSRMYLSNAVSEE